MLFSRFTWWLDKKFFFIKLVDNYHRKIHHSSGFHKQNCLEKKEKISLKYFFEINLRILINFSTRRTSRTSFGWSFTRKVEIKILYYIILFDLFYFFNSGFHNPNYLEIKKNHISNILSPMYVHISQLETFKLPEVLVYEWI